MLSFIFNCPDTSMLVQHWLEEADDVQETDYEGVICPACTRLHFFNRKTGKLLGQGKSKAASVGGLTSGA
jgi:hypothetical protein